MKEKTFYEMASALFLILGLVILFQGRNLEVNLNIEFGILVVSIGLILINRVIMIRDFDKIDQYIHEKLEKRIELIEKEVFKNE